MKILLDKILQHISLISLHTRIYDLASLDKKMNECGCWVFTRSLVILNDWFKYGLFVKRRWKHSSCAWGLHATDTLNAEEVKWVNVQLVVTPTGRAGHGSWLCAEAVASDRALHEHNCTASRVSTSKSKAVLATSPWLIDQFMTPTSLSLLLRVNRESWGACFRGN